MTFLLDANILLRQSEAGHRQHGEAMAATRLLVARGHEPVIAPQGLYEFWVVATRPKVANGLDMTPAEAAAEVVSFQAQFDLLPDGPDILPEWQRLVTTHGVSGMPAHDARLVAAMHVHGVANLLTFNVRDFGRYPGVRVWTPDEVLRSPP